ncbi:hypothetical protein V1L65_28155 [Paenibacillus sp. IITD108]
MISDEYFRSTSGDLFDYSIIKNINGQGTLHGDSTRPVNWALSVDITGNKYLIIETEMVSDFGGFYVNYMSDKKYRLEGRSSDDQWTIKCDDIDISSTAFSLVDNQTTFICSFEQIFLQKHFEAIKSVRAYISNFHFLGLESTNYGGSFLRDKFTIHIQNRQLEFKLLESSTVVKNLIKSGRIPSAIMSSLSVEINNDESIEDINNLLTNISFFLSTLTLNHNFCHVIEYESNDEVVMIEIANKMVSKYHGNILIDNLRISSGIKLIFEKSFMKYVELKEELDLVRFTHLIVELYQQRFIELKLATLIIAYEQLLTKYLLYSGVDIEKLENIQQKLGAINKLMRFIPKVLQDGELRDGVRNPLFHTGSIPFKTNEEIRSIYFEYQDLLMRIYLRIINYGGSYISRIDHNTSKPV